MEEVLYHQYNANFLELMSHDPHFQINIKLYHFYFFCDVTFVSLMAMANKPLNILNP